VEALLLEHPEVIEAAAFGVAHPTLGEEVCAAVRVRPGSRLGADDLSRALSGNLAAFKIPADWGISESPLPRNASGKLAKRELPALISAQRLCGG
jgi:acyl-coenzyme A synthetase/AMP-(fatty) acid ligase